VRFVPLFPPRFFCSWVTAWVKTRSSFLIAPGKVLSCSKAGFLTEYAELGKMRSGAARTAGGYGYTPAKGVLLMRITLHIGRFTVTIIVKSRNRHSAK